MRHAFLITAYRDFTSLISLVDQILSIDNAFLYINIDGRSKALICKFQEYLKKEPNPRIYLQTQTVRWGSYEHFDVYMQMAQLALNDHCNYFHTITGQCRIIKPIDYFVNFFEKNANLNYIQHFELPMH